MDTSPGVAERLLASLDDPVCEWSIANNAESNCMHLAVWLMASNCGCAAYFCSDHQDRMRTTMFGMPDPIYCSAHPNFGRVLVNWLPIP